MKRIFLLTIAILTVFTLNNCSSGGGDDRVKGTTTLYLVDEKDYSYSGVPYICDSMSDWRRTNKEGAFVFVQPDTCKFDFNGLDGVYGDEFDEVVRIVDYTNAGKGGIDYECSSFTVSSTYGDGSFDYNENDVCSFYL